MTQKNKVMLGDLLPDLCLIGDFQAHARLEILRIAPLESARPGDLVFVGQEALLPRLTEGRPAAAVVSESLFARAQELQPAFPLLCSRDAMLALAKASRHFLTEPRPAPGVHPTSVVHPAAVVAADASIGPFCQVGEGAEIGPGACLHSRVSVGDRTKVGAGAVLFPGVVVYQDCVLGARVRVHGNSVIGADGFGYVQERMPGGVKHVKIHHIGRVLIGDDTEIGASTSIDRGTVGDTVVGRGCIIDNQVQIGHNCQIGNGVIICGSTGLSGSVRVDDFAVIAGFVGIANKIHVGQGAQISAYSAVQSHIPAGQVWGGVPAMPHRQWLKSAVYLRKLPELLGKTGKSRKGEA